VRKSTPGPDSGPHVKAKDIKHRDVVALLDDTVDRGSPIATNRTLACVRKMFNYGVERSILETSPCVAVKAPSPTSATRAKKSSNLLILRS
jgi:site-specific recombinase XerD